jgi:hypothetical protein
MAGDMCTRLRNHMHGSSVLLSFVKKVLQVMIQLGCEVIWGRPMLSYASGMYLI